MYQQLVCTTCKRPFGGYIRHNYYGEQPVLLCEVCHRKAQPLGSAAAPPLPHPSINVPLARDVRRRSAEEKSPLRRDELLSEHSKKWREKLLSVNNNLQIAFGYKPREKFRDDAEDVFTWLMGTAVDIFYELTAGHAIIAARLKKAVALKRMICKLCSPLVLQLCKKLIVYLYNTLRSIAKTIV